MPSSAQCKEFINNIAYLIQEEAKKRGYHVCSPIIAQACIESNFGISQLASRWHNYFGMKCGSQWKGKSINLKTKEEYTVGQLTTIKDNFRVYDNMEDGVKGYFDFINTKRYANLKGAITPEMYATLIKNDGYATSSSYISTLLNYISRYDLRRFDWEDDIKEANPYVLSDKILRLTCRGESVRWLQFELKRNGYEFKVDGSFGLKTEAAVKKFQKDKKLTVDGIAGPKTIAALKEGTTQIINK